LMQCEGMSEQVHEPEDLVLRDFKFRTMVPGIAKNDDGVVVACFGPSRDRNFMSARENVESTGERVVETDEKTSFREDN